MCESWSENNWSSGSGLVTSCFSELLCGSFSSLNDFGAFSPVGSVDGRPVPKRAYFSSENLRLCKLFNQRS